MILEPEDDPRLESVADKLAPLRKEIEDADWHGKPVPLAKRQTLSRLTAMIHRGELWEPKF